MFANARMYSIDAPVSQHWRTLLEWIDDRAGIDYSILDHPAPQPLAAMWKRPDMACALMCGYPWITWSDRDGPRPVPLAVPLPHPARYGGRPFYWTDIVVHADSQIANVSDLFGKRLAFTVDDSYSGYQSLRYHFSPFFASRRQPLFAQVVGPLVTPRKVIDALLAGDADAGPLDAYWHDLLRLHEPDVASRLRVVDSTRPAPMPMLVASATIPADVRTSLVDALLAVRGADELATARAALLLDGFVRVDEALYVNLAERAHKADAAGYRMLQ